MSAAAVAALSDVHGTKAAPEAVLLPLTTDEVVEHAEQLESSG